MEMVRTLGEKSESRRAGAHLPSTLHLKTVEGPSGSSPGAGEGRRVKLRHFPLSQLKPRHQTYCSLLTQGDPRTGRCYLGPRPTLSWPKLQGGRRQNAGSGCGTQREGRAGKGTPGPTEGANF